jgi:hypothetical protein
MKTQQDDVNVLATRNMVSRVTVVLTVTTKALGSWTRWLRRMNGENASGNMCNKSGCADHPEKLHLETNYDIDALFSSPSDCHEFSVRLLPLFPSHRIVLFHDPSSAPTLNPKSKMRWLPVETCSVFYDLGGVSLKGKAVARRQEAESSF